ncbi:MAG: adenylate cyclase [Myxococcota bacterium]
MKLTFRLRITVALLLLALIPLIVVTYLLIKQDAERLKLAAREYRVAAAEIAVEAVDARIEAARTELHTVAAVLADTENVPEDRIRLTRAHLLGARFLDRVAVYFTDGTLVDVMSADEVGGPPVPSPLNEGVRGVAQSQQVAFLGVQNIDGRPWLPAVAVMRRVAPDGKPQIYGYVWTAIDIAPLSETVAGISERRFGGRDDRVWMVDRSLRIIAHAQQAQLFQSIEKHGILSGANAGSLRRDIGSTADYRGADGERRLGILVRIPDLGMGIAVEQSHEVAYAAAGDTVRTAFWVGLSFAVVAVLMGLWIGRRLAQPVQELAVAAGRIAGGDFASRVPETSSDEVGDLGRAFNTMSEALGDYRDQIVTETEIRSDLGRYLPAELVEQIVQRQASISLGGERRPITVLFADVVAFTPLTETEHPERTVAILNELFTFLTEIVFAEGGTVDKFMGDCLMAVFGAPFGHDDDPQRAVRAADKMIRWIETGNARWGPELGRKLELGIGIASGPAIVGNVGSERRMDYTVIGKTVNIAARLEGLAAPGQILMDESTRAAVVDDYDIEDLGPHELRGLSEPVQIYALVT